MITNVVRAEDDAGIDASVDVEEPSA